MIKKIGLDIIQRVICGPKILEKVKLSASCCSDWKKIPFTRISTQDSLLAEA